jgi:hypothetical protein
LGCGLPENGRPEMRIRALEDLRAQRHGDQNVTNRFVSRQGNACSLLARIFMGGTGLEPVTPSLSTRSRDSRLIVCYPRHPPPSASPRRSHASASLYPCRNKPAYSRVPRPAPPGSLRTPRPGLQVKASFVGRDSAASPAAGRPDDLRPRRRRPRGACTAARPEGFKAVCVNGGTTQ